MQYLLDRLQEPSTWRGLVMIVTSLGVALSPEQVAAIVATGSAIVGLIGVFTRDR